MQQRGKRLSLSPSDLNHYLACEHRTWLDLAHARGEIELHAVPRPDAELVAERGRRHEAAYLTRLEAEGRDVARVAPGDTEETAAAMRAGRDVIHQASFRAGNWSGQADFLFKVRTPSGLGPHAYEPADAKLATHPRPYFIFQLLFYAAMVGMIQARPPARIHLVLGTDEVRSFRPRDFQAYADRVQQRFLETLKAYRDGARPPYPYPVEHCAHCDWWARCRDRRRADDHLSLVASITRAQSIALEDAGVRRVSQLATLGEGTSVPGISGGALRGLRQQAWLQAESRELDHPLYELRPPEAGRGFARLPPPSPGDVFFDIEGDPHWGREGLEYLFGSATADGDHQALWAHDREQEQAAFERWVDWVSARLARHPDAHVYHYNHYEPTAIKALMARYGTREAEVDELLRRQAFVDLYTIVRQGLRVGSESYSLKALEGLYPFERDAEVTDPGGSILAYQEYLASRDDSRLEAIEAYNADDCRSTLALRDWLLSERGPAGYQAAEPPRTASAQQLERLAELERLEGALLADSPDDAHRLLADLLRYHRREARPEWWAYFERLGRTPGELRDEDTEAIGELVPADDVPLGVLDQSYLHPLRFPPQQHKLGAGIAVDPETQRGFEIPRVDDAAGLVWIKRGRRSVDKPLPRSLIPPKPIPQAAQEGALRSLAEELAARGYVPGAAFELLLRLPPRLRGDTLADHVSGLGDSALFVQGPPGSGKTYTGARLIISLLREGRRVGVAATSHKAIANLLDAVEVAAAEEQVSFRGMKKAGGGNPESHYESEHIGCTAATAAFPGDAGVRLLAGTPWLWAREEMRASVDVLFVDEAGQMALADALAIAGAAHGIVLLGDPQQLAHVSHGSHPRGAGSSVLEHLLGERDTVPPAEGVFLDRTYRMHPEVCRFVSEAFYDGRLSPVEGCERQSVTSAGGLSGAGVRLLEVEHAENRQTSFKEADRIAAEVARLLDGGRFTDATDAERALTLDDILVVAPYNAQVRALRDRLPEGARVGTVDKFQGQQAPVVFFSMTSSTGEDVPRGMDFLFSRNRLNVAISRAQALAIVLCSPRLLWARCNSVEQMRLVNSLCAFAEEAERQSSVDAPAGPAAAG